jgi:hypothetical protein
MIPLIFAQVAYAISLQQFGGAFVLKIFDCFSQAMVDILYLLASCYAEVVIVKPLTSRLGNSERYVVCKGFNVDNRMEMILALRKVLGDCIHQPDNTSVVGRILNIAIPQYFISRLEEINVMIGQPQIENIHQTLSMMDKHTRPDRIDQMVKNNIAKCVQWCQKYGVPYNTLTGNLFSGEPRFHSENPRFLTNIYSDIPSK